MNVITRLSDWFVNLSRTQKIVVRLLVLLVVLAVIFYIFFLPLNQVPLKIPIAQSSPEATAATERFWEVFHAEEYEKLPEVIDQLNVAYEIDSSDAVLTEILAGAHLWRFQERGRANQSAADREEDLHLAIGYADETAALERLGIDDKSTIPSVLAVANWHLDHMHSDEWPSAQAKLDMLMGTQIYPQFAGFVQGWILATVPADEEDWFELGLLGYRTMLNNCAGFTVPDDQRFDKLLHSIYSIKSYFSLQVCYNNPVAPHNIEGTFLGMGDLYLKQGNLPMAKLWYENTKTSPDYDTWRYRDILDERLDNLDTLSAKFVADGDKIDVDEPAMSFQSDISCGACHSQ